MAVFAVNLTSKILKPAMYSLFNFAGYRRLKALDLPLPYKNIGFIVTYRCLSLNPLTIILSLSLPRSEDMDSTSSQHNYNRKNF